MLKCHVNVANMFSDKCYRNVTVAEIPQTPHQWKMRVTPPRELETLPAKLVIDPTEGIMYGDSKLPPQWK